MAATVIPMPKFMAFSDAGAPLSAGLVYTYAAGTTTPLATYSDSDLTTPNANPVVLDSAGRATIYLTASSYKIVLKNSAGATVYTQDNIIAAAPYNVDLDVPIVAGEALTAGQAIYLSDGTGSRTAGRWYLTDSDTAAYSTTVITGFVTTALALGEEGSVRLLGQATVPGPLSVGLTYYLSGTPGAIGTTAGTFVKNMGMADSTTTLIMTVATPVTPGGSNTQVQFNDSGVLGGDSGFTFIKATDAVAIAGATTVGGTLGVTGAITSATSVALTGTTNNLGTITSGVWNAGAVTSSGGISGTTGAFSSTVTGGTYNGQTISSAANFTGTVTTGDLLTAAYATNVKMFVLNNTTTTATNRGAGMQFQAEGAQHGYVGAAGVLNGNTSKVLAFWSGAGLGQEFWVNNGGGASMSLSSAGLLTVSGFGTHLFSASGSGANDLKIANTSSNAAAHAQLTLAGDTAISYIYTTSSNYPTSGVNTANALIVYSGGAGGTSIASAHASGVIRFYSGGSTNWMTLGTGGILTLTGADPIRCTGMTSSTGTAVIKDGSGYLYTLSSSRRYKTDAPLMVSPEALTAFLALSPEGWDYTGQQNGAFGFIAEGLAELPIRNAYGTSPLINYDSEGRPESNRDFALIGLQHLVLQQHDARLAEIEAKLLTAGV